MNSYALLILEKNKIIPKNKYKYTKKTFIFNGGIIVYSSIIKQLSESISVLNKINNNYVLIFYSDKSQRHLWETILKKRNIPYNKNIDKVCCINDKHKFQFIQIDNLSKIRQILATNIKYSQCIIHLESNDANNFFKKYNLKHLKKYVNTIFFNKFF